MDDFKDPLKTAFIEEACNDLFGKAGGSSVQPVSASEPTVEAITPSKNEFAASVMKDLGVTSRVPVTEVKAPATQPKPVLEKPVVEDTKIVESFMAEAESETTDMLKKLLKGMH